MPAAGPLESTSVTTLFGPTCNPIVPSPHSIATENSSVEAGADRLKDVAVLRLDISRLDEDRILAEDPTLGVGVERLRSPAELSATDQRAAQA
mmetsp:Transcript_6998/g.15721  ORF Transcript_6998/g.15721 Transcript_6998/m.15721 type:complete len:93 (+) Transcript_6998:390-668(+)|eukprot:CAMPEP_0181200592 /NCGR_PEP_ID=MMETSP1096-20121128/17852_1 /TAXON_ID=156174 ORGANISM="Chrysochromulina ericina, Strain CCMP281" /NCGR_SAMPLE_ID=MMETSP1096 /ASSEMBLY_ACC=CAM_ASM_000453 /LENGTH=92 /DNA_ID=CAMNT_0023290971 /DNA_START=316 /DNA_END=594 /DNA_ORIENTATION=+